MGEIERRRWTTGNITVLALSVVFIIVAIAFAILGTLSLSIENPNAVLGVGMLIGAAIVGIAGIAGIVYTIRNLVHPRPQS
ncbi:asparagine N-glycosylation enzyme membrane subunit Stt3 [Microbacterium marinum]|jgi:asparagine N-glycosylation enzyme membrane subunit Stt3|uniref:Asparagine N-glycosylation enzyme membrane subunit Stt3 n=1 Tax=Microbacterium marinum TaxID=421115 RepID=A0A7W7BPP8_9MICO|nr:hypothetical protein [Microbacterium marinum]MBB4666535.1 asparagine N-glycosylation enzyme membrane subunit Stt3 [Microbacterium marinum]HCJ48893.1 hypothetical protein [Microbacterium sp.]